MKAFSQIVSYHDFRVVAGTKGKNIVVADIDLAENVHVGESDRISKDLEMKVQEKAHQRRTSCGVFESLSNGLHVLIYLCG